MENNWIINPCYALRMPIYASTSLDALEVVFNYLLPKDSRNKRARIILKNLIENNGRTECYTLAKLINPKLKRSRRVVYLKELKVYRNQIKRCVRYTLKKYLKDYGLSVSFRDENVILKNVYKN